MRYDFVFSPLVDDYNRNIFRISINFLSINCLQMVFFLLSSRLAVITTLCENLDKGKNVYFFPFAN